MKLIITIDQDITTSFSALTNNFTQEVLAYFEHQDYGEKFKTIMIILTCWEDPKMYEAYPRRKRYNQKKDELYFDIFYDFELLSSLAKSDRLKFITSIIYNELTHIVKEYLDKKKLKFNYEAFQNDLKSFFEVKGYDHGLPLE